VATHDLGVELKLLCLAQWLKKEGRDQTIHFLRKERLDLILANIARLAAQCCPAGQPSPIGRMAPKRFDFRQAASGRFGAKRSRKIRVKVAIGYHRKTMDMLSASMIRRFARDWDPLDSTRRTTFIEIGLEPVSFEGKRNVSIQLFSVRGWGSEQANRSVRVKSPAASRRKSLVE
jgi:hypothetical protein